jgi:hypothetical protein
MSLITVTWTTTHCERRYVESREAITPSTPQSLKAAHNFNEDSIARLLCGIQDGLEWKTSTFQEVPKWNSRMSILKSILLHKSSRYPILQSLNTTNTQVFQMTKSLHLANNITIYAIHGPYVAISIKQSTHDDQIGPKLLKHPKWIWAFDVKIGLTIVWTIPKNSL